MSVVSKNFILHLDGKGIKFDFRKIAKFIKDTTGLKVVVENLKFRKGSLKNIAKGFARCRVRENSQVVSEVDIDYELKVLANQIKSAALYDGFKLSLFYQGLLKNDRGIHIVLTNRLAATLDDAKKLHIRSIILAEPAIISLSGIVEGPAKPKEFYALKHRLALLGIWEQNEPLVKEKFKQKFVDYADKRMNEVLKGLILQAAVFVLTGKAFCENRKCRLFNAHWQEDLIYSQVRIGKLCAKHRKIVNLIKHCNHGVTEA